VARLMREEGLIARRRRRFRRTTVADCLKAAAPNRLGRRFSVDSPDRVWAGDITCFPTRDGWLYLAVFLDLFSRRVVGWSMSESSDQTLVCDAFEAAVARRQPRPGLVAHSDRGAQYMSDAYQRRLTAAGALCSMSRTGDCWDNAVVESFNSALKVELALTSTISRNEARNAVFDYIETFYNPKRRHSTLGYLSPAEFERRNF
jgi:putative transposase